jgi:hypothetical protein
MIHSGYPPFNSYILAYLWYTTIVTQMQDHGRCKGTTTTVVYYIPAEWGIRFLSFLFANPSLITKSYEIFLTIL